jgi:hypothetical protein
MSFLSKHSFGRGLNLFPWAGRVRGVGDWWLGWVVGRGVGGDELDWSPDRRATVQKTPPFPCTYRCTMNGMEFLLFPVVLTLIGW